MGTFTTNFVVFLRVGIDTIFFHPVPEASRADAQQLCSLHLHSTRSCQGIYYHCLFDFPQAIIKGKQASRLFILSGRSGQ